MDIAKTINTKEEENAEFSYIICRKCDRVWYGNEYLGDEEEIFITNQRTIRKQKLKIVSLEYKQEALEDPLSISIILPKLKCEIAKKENVINIV